MTASTIHIGWATFPDPQSSARFASKLIDLRLAACVQVDTPVTSYYHWEGKTEVAGEVRLWVKFPSRNGEQIRDLLVKEHPYDTPQWVVVQAAEVLESYGKWVDSSCQ